MLPDRPPEAFVDDVRALVEGTGVEVEVIMAFTPAASPTDNELYRAIEAVIAENHAGARVTPSMMTGFTDSHFTRDAGIDSYGFQPTVVPETEFARIHGNLDGQVAAFFVMVVAAAEVVVGLAIIMTIFRTRRSASVDDASLLKY